MSASWDLVALDGDRLTLITHPASACDGGYCTIHRPSAHPLCVAPLHWRQDRLLLERLCSHGIGHPDADHITYVARVSGPAAAEVAGVHGCDGCCS